MNKPLNKPFDLEQIRKDFPMLNSQVRDRSLIYFDNAATSLKPQPVIDRMTRFYLYENANVHRAAHYWADQGTLAFEGARERVRRFIGAASPAEIVFTKGTTEAINLIAYSLFEYLKEKYSTPSFSKFEKDEILITELEHHANIVPWQMAAQRHKLQLRAVPLVRSANEQSSVESSRASEEGQLDLQKFHSMLNSRTALVAITGCSNALGNHTPLEEIIQAARQVGAMVLVDAAQMVAHRPIDVQQLDCDFLVFSGHKILGPFATGVLYSKLSHLENMPPYQTGGSMIAKVEIENTTFTAPPQKFEAGTPGIAEALGLETALDYLENIGWDNIEKQETKLLALATEQLQNIPGLKILGTKELQKKAPIISFVIDGIHPSDFGVLLDQDGIAVRVGHHCTQPLMKALGLGSTVRASFAFYNTEEEVKKFIESLYKIKELMS